MAAADLVKDWYKDYLGREPGQQGLNFWAGQLSGGGNAQSTLNAFKAAATKAGETWQTPAPNQNAAGSLITNATPARRASDPVRSAGLLASAQASQPGITHGEYSQRPEARLHSIYTGLLGREPDKAGFDYYRGQIDQGVPLADIEAQIRASEEGLEGDDRRARALLGVSRAPQPGPAPQPGAPSQPPGGPPRSSAPLPAPNPPVTAPGEPGPILDERAPRAPAPNPPTLTRPEPGQGGGAGTGVDPRTGAFATRFEPGRFSAERYDPTLRDVDASQETVEARIQRLLAENGAYLSEARTRGREEAASRGLLDSSISAAAAEREAIRAALPIAQQDAGTYLEQGMQNQAFSNRAGEFNAGEGNELIRAEQAYDNARALSDQEHLQARDRADQGFGFERARSNQDFEEQRDLNAQEGDIRRELATLDSDLAVRLETLRTENQALLSGRSEAGSIYREGINSIGNLLTNSALSPEQQRAAMDVILGETEAALEFMAGMQST